MPSRFLRDIQSADIDFSIAEVATISRGTALEVPVPPTPHVCRICGRGLTDSSEVAVQRCNACPSTANPELISALMQWRDQVAQEMGVLPWLVFTDQTLRAIAEFTPKTREELLNIQGVNPAKAHLFSDAIFTINKNF
jgi:DNA helicase-2/ATP-dependent DNA helicase PcrA